MTKLSLLALASAAALMALPAYAQSNASSPGGADRVLAQVANQNPPPAPGTDQLWTTRANVGGTIVNITANPPIPDTHRNRKLFGPPLGGHRLTRPEPPVGSGSRGTPAPGPQ
jgi:hypothetical protein